jgi:hypothetical protein
MVALLLVLVVPLIVGGMLMIVMTRRCASCANRVIRRFQRR